MTEQLISMFRMGRTRLMNQIPNIKDIDLSRKLHPSSNSIGFLLRHISEVEQLFAKNVFGLEIRVMASTVGKGVHDTGKFTDLHELKDNLNLSEQVLLEAIKKQDDEAWTDNITTPEFGTVTKAEALSRIITHTAYHAGQIALILKYADK